MVNHGMAHQGYLNELIKRRNLAKVGVDTGTLDAILVEPTWHVTGECNEKSMPDIITVHSDYSYHMIELKGTKYKLDKACSQIESGFDCAIELGWSHCLDQLFGTFVWYNAGRYNPVRTHERGVIIPEVREWVEYNGYKSRYTENGGTE